MNKGAVIFLVVVIVSGVLSVWFRANQPPINDDSDGDYYNKELPLILPNLDPITPKDNLTKGMTLTCNFTVSSMADKKLVIPLDFKLYIITSGYGHEINPQEAGFYDYYVPTVFVLDPFRTLSSLVTLEISEDVFTDHSIKDRKAVDLFGKDAWLIKGGFEEEGFQIFNTFKGFEKPIRTNHDVRLKCTFVNYDEGQKKWILGIDHNKETLLAKIQEVRTKLCQLKFN